jgi:5-methylcytosine-specific restriction protein A
MCLSKGIIKEGAVVDHIVSRQKAPELMWEPTNWQTLCTPCHSATKQSVEHLGYDKRKIDHSGWPTDPLHPVNRKKSFF